MRLLVVEDEHKVASFLKRGLEEAGHGGDGADAGAGGGGGGRVCPALLNNSGAFILDCRLPDKDGRQVCRDLRAQGVTTPALLLTARDSASDKILGFNSGADQYMSKPFDFNELLARVRALGRHAQPVQMRTLAVADLEIDPAARSVRRGGREA